MTMSFDPGPEAPEGPFVPGAATAPDMSVLEIADGLFWSYAADLTRLREKIQAGETGELKESGRLVRDLRAATQLVLEERSKVDKLRKDAAGQVGAGALDLVAARDEIGRRLACLRRAAGG
ncbi:permease [Paracoccus binzhouensis]|uniref:permease n=1 Tax=Paracoccus binzhouensis TaxID=2796149 RepID=UPI0018EF0347|nr:permease [Paracoccus binzhouensis]